MTKLFLAIAAQLLLHQAPPAQDPKTDISEKEAIEFARKIERDLLDDKPEVFDNAFDVDGLVKGAIKGLDLRWGEALGYVMGTKKSLSLGRSLAAGSGNSYRFLRLRPGEGPRRLVFRLWSNEGGLNYHDVRLKRGPKGDIQIEDLMACYNGDWMAPLLRLGAMGMIAEDPGRRVKLEGPDRDLVLHYAKLKKLDQESREGDPGAALALFAALPDTLKRDRLLQIMRLRAASRSTGDEFPDAEAQYRKLFPGDFYPDFAGIAAHLGKNRFDKALKAYDGLERFAGGDPMLNVSRGSIYVVMGRLGDAKKSGQIAAKEVPYHPDPCWLLLTVSLKEKAHAETVKHLTALEKDFNLVIGDLQSNQNYADFVKTPEYREWLKSRASK